MSFSITTTAFQPDQMIPSRFTCDGADVSPQLSWKEAPAGTKGFALICDDPDAPVGTFTHWVLYGLPAGTSGLPEEMAKDPEVGTPSCRQGRNDFGKIGYNGPCPPRGSKHRYYFKLFALDKEIQLPGRSSRADVEREMKGHILAQTQVMGLYQRK